MTPEETRAILALCVLASFADGDKHERERDEIKRVAQNFSPGDLGQLSTLYQDVLMKRVTLASVVQQLQSDDAKQLAYEMAVCVCDADGTLSAPEQRFLAEIRPALGLDATASAAFVQDAQSIAALPMADNLPVAASASTSPRAVANEAELDSTILNAAIVNGALELLPETLSTMAIIPLQMKLVWRLGKAYGFELDSGHIK
ncbi:MAG: TerB family tellurite resistance protein, partial [Burkholderiaceae bacterium]|nr:TerB family tellurite resistance protein [Burkholderiaceae bacterium]